MLDTMRTGKDGDREQRTLYILIIHTEKGRRSTAGDGLKITQMREIWLNSVIETISTPHYILYTIYPLSHAPRAPCAAGKRGNLRNLGNRWDYPPPPA